MVWLIILIVPLCLLAWLLISPVLIEIDTRVPRVQLRWVSIGSARLSYENEWRLNIRVLFFRRTIPFSENLQKPRNKRIPKKRKGKKPGNTRAKILGVIKTFRVTNWRVAIDTGDYTRNAQLYPLNYLPHTMEHTYINFTNENYLVLKIRNRPWRILYAFIQSTI